MMITFAAIDGTSNETGTAANPGDYQRTFAQSFCNQLKRNQWVPFTNPYYIRGPYLEGSSTGPRATQAFNHVIGQWTSGAAKAIFLAGYSRGGAAAIEVARKLKYEVATPIPVECLILFDAVDRTNSVGGYFSNTPIPDNVKTVIYAQRNKLTTMSRPSFGNCGMSKENPNMDYRFQKFFATHGGIGGTPWKKAVDPLIGIVPIPTIHEPGEFYPTNVTAKRDKLGSQIVKSWVLPQVITSYALCQARLGAATAPSGQPGVPPINGTPPGSGPAAAKILATHKVKTGDSLSKIAIQYCGRD